MIKQLQNYLDYLINVKNSKQNTISSYTNDLGVFLSYIKSVGVELSKVNANVMETYRIYLKECKKTQSTINRNLIAVRGFIQFLCVSGELNSNPCKSMKLIKAEKKLPQVLSGEKIEQLLNLPSQTEVKGIRDKAMIELLYATGMRASEIIELNIQDIDIKQKFVNCNLRVIPIYQTAADCVEKYTKVRNELLKSKTQKTMFVNMSGEKMTRQGFWKIIKSYAGRLDLQEEITPNILRQSFAVHLLQSGAKLQDIQEMMGHSDITSTKIYQKAAQTKIEKSYNKHHPRAKNN